MNEIVLRPHGKSLLPPFKDIDELRARVDELFELRRDVASQLDAHYPVQLRNLPKLPEHTDDTISLLWEATQVATRDQIAKSLAVLNGLYGTRAESEVIATDGVSLYEAEGVSTIALYDATLALLRPIRTRSSEPCSEWRLEPRKFPPTPSEIIELRKYHEAWQRRLLIVALPEEHEALKLLVAV
jgi:hypothetical protein